MALRGLLDSGFPLRYVVVGDGSERQRLLFTVNDLGLQDHVSLVPAATDAAIERLMKEADVYLAIRLDDQSPSGLAHATAQKTPMVMTLSLDDSCSVFGERALMVPQRDPQAIIRIVKRLWHNQQPVAPRDA